MFNNMGCCPKATPTYTCCNNVVNRCFVEDIPHYVNYHTHVVNNCVRRHVNIPTYSTDEETVISDEYMNGQPIYYQNMNQAPNAQMNMNDQMNQTNAQNINNTFNNMNPNFNNVNPDFNQGFNPFNF